MLHLVVNLGDHCSPEFFSGEAIYWVIHISQYICIQVNAAFVHNYPIKHFVLNWTLKALMLIDNEQDWLL